MYVCVSRVGRYSMHSMYSSLIVCLLYHIGMYILYYCNQTTLLCSYLGKYLGMLVELRAVGRYHAYSTTVVGRYCTYVLS